MKNGVTHLQRNWGHVGAFFAETEENNLLKKNPQLLFFCHAFDIISMATAKHRRKVFVS